MFNSFFKHVLLILFLACFLSAEFAGARSAVERPSCLIDYYFVPACEQCRYIENNILPQLKEMFGERIKICKHNLYSAEEYSKAQDVLNRLAVQGNDNVFVVIDGEIYVGGLKDLRDNLIPAVEEQLSSSSLVTLPGPAHPERPPARAATGRYSFPFSFVALLTAGLLDGVNPCAFATIIFLISSLLAGGGRRQNLFLIGLGFCSSVYLTYFLLGLGLFQVFRLSIARLWLSNAANWLLIIALLVLAIVSFRDAWIFRLTGRQNDIILKLPGRTNKLIHNIIRLDLSQKHYFAGSFLLGCFVTILESVCTGQLYVPALAFLARMSEFRLQAVVYLALYNLMFVLPLIAIFILAYYGVSRFALVAWSRKNVFWVKCAQGCFFVFLAVVLSLT